MRRGQRNITISWWMALLELQLSVQKPKLKKRREVQSKAKYKAKQSAEILDVEYLIFNLMSNTEF